jgi:hypothetical protein
MKSSLRAALALGALALASSQCFASTVNVDYGMGPATVYTGAPAVSMAGDPSFYELNVGAGGGGVVSTIFKLIDTIPDGKTVTYQLFADTNNAIGSYALGAAVTSWVFTDLPNNSVNSVMYQLGANTQYVLKMSTDGADLSSTQISAVPLPAAAWLFGSALMGFGALRRKQKSEVAPA